MKTPPRALINPLLAVAAIVALALYERWRAWRRR